MLEDQLQPKLQLAHLGASRVDRAERHAVECRVGVSPVRMIQEVERLETQLDVLGCTDMELLGRGEVPVDDAGTNHFAAARAAECAGRRSGESGGVEPMSDRRSI